MARSDGTGTPVETEVTGADSPSVGPSRRAYLRAVSAGTVAGLAGLSGCVGQLPGLGKEPVRLGSILPSTGALSDYGPGMQAAVELAVKHVNAAGGPRGRTVELHRFDSGTDVETAKERYDAMVGNHDVVGFVGTAASHVSAALAERAAADGIVQISPASTSPVLTEAGYRDDGLKYFARTAPSDWQQGRVLSQVLSEFIHAVQGDKGDLMGDIPEIEDAAFLHVDNTYGEKLAAIAANYFEGEKGVRRIVPYDPTAADYAETLDAVAAGEPDAVGLIGYPEAAERIVSQWIEGGYFGQLAFSEGLNSQALLDSFSPGMLSGVHISAPAMAGTESSARFKDALGSEPSLYAAHAYDATFLLALALQRAGKVSSQAVARKLRSVSRPPGKTVLANGFGKAKHAGNDGVDYRGASGNTSLNEALEPVCPFEVIEVFSGTRRTRHRYEASQFNR